MKHTIKIATMLVACMIAGVASANLTTRPEVTVSFSDLDLKHEVAQEILYRRLKAAASRVCGSTHYRIAGSVARLAENKACYEKAMNGAVQALDIPALSELHGHQARPGDARN